MSLQELALRAYRVGLGLEYDGCISGNGYKSLGHMGYVCRMGNNAPAITVHLDKLENQRKRLTEYEQRESILKHKEIEIEQKEKSLKEEKIKFEEIKSFTEQHESTLKQKETEIDERENLLKQKETTYKQIGEVFDTLMEFEKTKRIRTKTRMNFTIDRGVASRFKKYCREHGYNMSSKVERAIKGVIKKE